MQPGQLSFRHRGGFQCSPRSNSQERALARSSRVLALQRRRSTGVVIVAVLIAHFASLFRLFSSSNLQFPAQEHPSASHVKRALLHSQCVADTSARGGILATQNRCAAAGRPQKPQMHAPDQETSGVTTRLTGGVSSWTLERPSSCALISKPRKPPKPLSSPKIELLFLSTFFFFARVELKDTFTR